MIILMQIWYYEGAWRYEKTPESRITTTKMITTTTFLVLVLIGFLLELYPEILYSYIYNISTVFFMISRSSQIMETIQAKSTGSLALIPFMLNTAGNLARLFTLLVETDDWSLIGNMVIGTCQNFTIVVLFFVFWKNTEAEMKKKVKAE